MLHDFLVRRLFALSGLQFIRSCYQYHFYVAGVDHRDAAEGVERRAFRHGRVRRHPREGRPEVEDHHHRGDSHHQSRIPATTTRGRAHRLRRATSGTPATCPTRTATGDQRSEDDQQHLRHQRQEHSEGGDDELQLQIRI